MPDTGLRTDYRMRQLINQLVAFVAVLDTDGRLKDVDEAALKLAGLTLEEVQGIPFWDCYWWNYDPLVQERIREDIILATKGETRRKPAIARTENDGRLPVMLQIGPILDENGEVQEIIASGADASREAAHSTMLEHERERLSLLNRELRHRVGNVFATVLAALSMSARQADTKDSLMALATSRIRALSKAQDVTLDEASLRGVCIETLLDAIVMAHAPSGEALEISGRDQMLHRELVTPLTLVLHELATNATKHGAWKDGKGKVRISWSRVSASGNDSAQADKDWLELVWSEEHPPRQHDPRQPERRKGFGSTLLSRCAAQANGEVEQDKRETGWTTTLRLPLVPLH